jgi:hypothetical protein
MGGKTERYVSTTGPSGQRSGEESGFVRVPPCCRLDAGDGPLDVMYVVMLGRHLLARPLHRLASLILALSSCVEKYFAMQEVLY